jgi:hypothetical protein
LPVVIEPSPGGGFAFGFPLRKRAVARQKTLCALRSLMLASKLNSNLSPAFQSTHWRNERNSLGVFTVSLLQGLAYPAERGVKRQRSQRLVKIHKMRQQFPRIFRTGRAGIVPISPEHRPPDLATEVDRFDKNADYQ